MKNTADHTPELRERLAEYAHEAWTGWMGYLFSKCESSDDGTMTIPQWAVDRWSRHACTDYGALPEKERESDRAEADKILAIVSGDRMEQSKPRDIAEKIYAWMSEQKYGNESILHSAVCCDFIAKQIEQHMPGDGMPEETCVWTTSGELYKADCGMEFGFRSNGERERNRNWNSIAPYCPSCGKRIEVKS